MKKIITKVFMQIGAVCLAASLVTNCADIGAATSSNLRYDNSEHKIIGQATGIGTLIGAGAGYAIAKNNGKSRLGGALAGGALGGFIGNQVGKGQAEKARNARMRNEQLSNLIAKARANNAKLIAFNRATERRIAAIRAAEASKRKAMARAEIARIDNAQSSTNAMLERRRQTMKKLSSNKERSQYQTQTNNLRQESRKLARHRSTLARY